MDQRELLAAVSMSPPTLAGVERLIAVVLGAVWRAPIGAVRSGLRAARAHASAGELRAGVVEGAIDHG